MIHTGAGRVEVGELPTREVAFLAMHTPRFWTERDLSERENVQCQNHSL